MCEEFLYDRNIYFDMTPTKLNLLKGERSLAQYNDVEDVKGNPDFKGRLTFTNIRVMWWQDQKPVVNLSIGLGTIFFIEQKVQNNNRTYSTVFRTKVNNTQRYEFHFNNQDRTTSETLRKIAKLYLETSLCREIKVQFNMISQKKLNLIEKEQIINQYVNTISVSNDEKDVTGSLIFTNMRFVWFCYEKEIFNISIPWISVRKIQKKTSKNLYAVIVEVHSEFGGYYMGYRNQEMDKMLNEFHKLHLFFTENPVYGIEINEKQQVQKHQFTEQVQIVQSIYNQSRYLESSDEQREIITSPELGIAIEKIPENIKLSDLWNIIKQN